MCVPSFALSSYCVRTLPRVMKESREIIVLQFDVSNYV